MFTVTTTRTAAPSWRVLYAVVGLLLGLVVVADIVASDVARWAVEGAGIVAVFGAMAIWVRCNRRALGGTAPTDQERGCSSGPPARRCCPACGAPLASGAGPIDPK